MNIRSLLAVVAVSFAVLACDKADLPDDIVNNDGPGTVNPANVVAAKSEYRKMLNLSDGDVTLNSKGLPVKILGCDIEYLPSTRAEGMTVRIKDYCYPEESKYDTFDFTIGANGFANLCKETQANGEQYYWKFGYNSDARLVHINYDGDVITMRYDKSGNLVNIKYKDYAGEKTDVNIFYTDYPNYGWMPYTLLSGSFCLPGNAGKIFYLTGTDIFWTFYLAGLVGPPVTNVPSYIHTEYFPNNEEYYHHHLYKQDWGNGEYTIWDKWEYAWDPQWSEYEPQIEDWRNF